MKDHITEVPEWEIEVDETEGGLLVRQWCWKDYSIWWMDIEMAYSLYGKDGEDIDNPHGTLAEAKQAAVNHLTESKEKKDHHTHCHDCGQFLPKRLWVAKDHSWKKHALCSYCRSQYDD